MKWTKNQMIIGLDIGNYNTKTTNFCFTSGYKEVGENSSFEDKLVYAGKTYAPSSERMPIINDKTTTEDYFVTSLIAIGKEFIYTNIEEGYYKVILSLGLPPDKMDMLQLRENLMHYFKKRDVITFTMNNKKFSIQITDVKVCPQCFSAMVAPVLTDQMIEEKKSVGVLHVRTPLEFVRQEPSCYAIDLGGGTVDVILLKDGKPSPDVHKSFDWGVVNLYHDIAYNATKQFDYNLSEDTINNVLLNKPVRISDDIKDFIRVSVGEYAQDLLTKFSERKYDLKGSYVVFLGGTSQILKSTLTEMSDLFGQLDFIGDLCANVKGFEELTCNLLKR